MKKAGRLLLLAVCGGLMGCGTLMHGTSQKIPVTATPEGAVASAAGGAACTTPCVLELSRKNDHIITLTKDGYEGATVPVRHVLSKAVYGNIVFGLLPGWGVDALSGGQYRLAPETVQAELKPLPKPAPQPEAGVEALAKEAAPKPAPATAPTAAPKRFEKAEKPYGIAVDSRGDFPVSHRVKKTPRRALEPAAPLRRPRLSEASATAQPGAFPVSYRVKTAEPEEQTPAPPQESAQGPKEGDTK